MCAEVGAHPGLVDLASFGVIDAALGATQPTADWLLVHVTSGYASIAILRGHDLIFYRNRAEEADGDLAGLVHQTAMYYEDRLGGTAAGFKRVMLAGTGPLEGRGLELVRRDIEGRLGLRTESVAGDRIARFTDRIAADPEVLGTVAPLVGLLARGRAVV